MKKLCLAVAVACLGLVAQANADTIRFSFSGVLPSGASSHSMVADGETFLAIFDIDNTIVDSSASDPTEGTYSAAVIGGSLEFSGGFVSSDSFADLTVAVSDNQFGGIEGVGVVAVDSAAPRVAVLTDDLSTLSSDELPTPGTSILSNSTRTSLAFAYNDGFGDIGYSWADGEAILFEVSAVPEPSTTGCLLLFACAGILRRKRSQTL